MLFSSIPFLYYFLPVVLILYWIAPKKLKNAVLLASSLFFYAWGEKLLVLLFITSIVIGWSTALLMERLKDSKKKKLLLSAITVYDLGLLGYFKYCDFFIENINHLTGSEIPLLKVALPIGISFYTFQLLSYNIDVYRGNVSAQKNLIHFGAYVSMFPQLIAGPIVRYADIQGALESRTHSLDKTAAGVSRFVIGLSKKVLIANIMGEICVNFRQTTDISVLYYWMYAIAYMLQIYYDFSGYSDMAIGLGKIFGFDFMENFNYPYVSASITEFWRRWHISLGSWFRDYVYIPLGGNRRGLKRQLFNIFLVWMLTGFWHGASWNFVLWGLYFGILLTIEKMFLLKKLNGHPVLSRIYALFFVMAGFLIFNAATPVLAIQDIAGLFSFGKLPVISSESIYYLQSYGILIFAAIVGSTTIPGMILKNVRKNDRITKILDIAEPFFYGFLLLLVTAYLVDGSFNPFLYFRF